MTTSETILHPQPQLARKRWLDLRGMWGFSYDDDDRGVDEGWFDRADQFTRTILVPFPPESQASGIGDTGFHPCVWYRREFIVPQTGDSERVRLHFGAVDYRAEVWVDGRHVVSHEGGHTPFAADITPALIAGSTHVLVVRAQDDPLDMALPRGKQDWRRTPHVIWYHRTTGIWQPVWLEIAGSSHIADLRWTPDPARATLGLAMALTRHDDQPLKARIRLFLHGRLLVDDTCLVNAASLSRDFALDYARLGLEPDQVLWSPEHPNLIEADVSLLAGDDELDAVSSYAGMRSVGTGHGRFWLNGNPIFLRMALEQGYWPGSHLAAPSDQALRDEVAAARSLGFNGVRIHQKVEDPRFLYWCDRLGLMVWDEMPSALVFSETAIERVTREWMEVLHRDYSHPCVIAWVPFNESWGVPNVREDGAQRRYITALYHLTHALDRTRPVIGNDGWEHAESDIHSIHDYTFDGSSLRERYGSDAAVEQALAGTQPQHHVILLPGAPRDDQPVMITEFGGLSYRPDEGAEWFGYGTVRSSEEFERKYDELVSAIVASPAIAGFCYTQLTDTLQETNGLLTEQRVPKINAAVLRRITSRVSRATPGDRVNELRDEAVRAESGAGV